MKTMPVPVGGYKPPSGRVAGGSSDSVATAKAKPKKGVIPPQFLKKGAKKK